MPDVAHLHRFVAGQETPLLLLHGSDGNESDLVPLAEELAPTAPILAVRGTVVMSGGYAFVRRRPDRTLDEADISTRAAILAQYVRAAGAEHGLTRRPIAIGYSNGAIMSAALVITDPDLLAGAVLLRPLSPFSADTTTRLDGIPLLIIDGAHDERRSPGDGQRLADRLRRTGASVRHHELTTGHAITGEDVAMVRDWLADL